ncbi:alpha/beta hydrolase fold domain-containing protein [Kitasatospora sp. NPDC059571]|uniref:alpha/beta hydrolase fold domain-containing protein n=1 Tax=Kitasatospora sp. NPDC059571 TaxID=3346871 RepID=UPI0036AC9B8E
MSEDLPPGLFGPGAERPAAARREGITYALVPGHRPLLLDLHRPRRPWPVPVVVWIHGGAFLGGDRRYLPDTLAPGSLFRRLNAAGLACATIDYRLSGEARFPAQLDDVRAAVAMLTDRAGELGLEGRGSGMGGESGGATLAALAALADDRAAAAVLWYPMTDPLADGVDTPDSPVALLLGGRPSERPELARQAGAVHQVRPGAPPFLLMHGADDRQLPPAHSRRLHERMREAGNSSELRVVPGADHCFEGAADIDALIGESVAFLRRHLLPDAAAEEAVAAAVRAG